ncbi:MAG: hypothetical protein BECKG1743E_GA0114224_103021, partial [Candidatus Kentron sp. G]
MKFGTRKRSYYGINEHFEEVFNAVRECETTFAYSSFVSALVIEEASQSNPDKAKQRLDAIASFSVIKNTPEAECYVLRNSRDIVPRSGMGAGWRSWS